MSRGQKGKSSGCVLLGWSNGRYPWNRGGHVPGRARATLLVVSVLLAGSWTESLAFCGELEPSNDLSAAFEWTGDSGGGKPKAAAVVGLDFDGQGSVTAIAFQPGERWTCSGTYAASAGRIEFDVPELGWKAEKQEFSVRDGVLTLPFQVLTDKPGTSTWRSLPPARAPGLRALQLFDGYVRQGLSGEEAQDRVASELTREFSRAPGRLAAGPGGSAPLPKIDVRTFTVEKDYRNLHLAYDDGNPSEIVMLRTFPLGPPERTPLPLTLHPIGGDPRSQRPFEPVCAGDNPGKLLAWLLVPGLNSSFYSYEGPVFRADGAVANVKVRGQTNNSKSYGIDPDHHRLVLEWAGYEVKQAIDGEVTLKAVVDALRAQPGLLLISTHGTMTTKAIQTTLGPEPRTVPLFMSGVVLYDYWQKYDRPEDREAPFLRDEMRRRLDEQVESVKELFPDLPPPGNEVRYRILERYISPIWIALSAHSGQIWLAYSADFLRLVVDHYHLDFSRSAVIASACDSATNDEAAQALRPKVFFGFNATVYIRAAARLEKFLLSGMARPTFSAREIFTRAFIILGNQVQFYIEDQHLASRVMAGDNGILSLRAFGNEGTVALTGKDDSGTHLMRYQPYSSVVFWLMFMNRWSADLADGRKALEDSYTVYWSQKKRPGLANAYAMQGIVGDHFPEKDEVALATQAVTGSSSFVERVINGRFTLNDGPKRPSLNPPPWDKKKK